MIDGETTIAVDLTGLATAGECRGGEMLLAELQQRTGIHSSDPQFAALAFRIAIDAIADNPRPLLMLERFEGLCQAYRDLIATSEAKLRQGLQSDHEDMFVSIFLNEIIPERQRQNTENHLCIDPWIRIHKALEWILISQSRPHDMFSQPTMRAQCCTDLIKAAAAIITEIERLSLKQAEHGPEILQ